MAGAPSPNDLERALDRGDAAGFRRMAESNGIDFRYLNGETALMMAARRGDRGCAEWLLDQGADADARNPAGKSALMLAIRGGHPHLAKLFLRRRPAPAAEGLAPRPGRLHRDSAAGAGGVGSAAEARSGGGTARVAAGTPNGGESASAAGGRAARPPAGMAAALRESYRALGISWGAGLEEARRARNRLIKEHHPDLNRGDADAERRARQINQAYRMVLGNLG